MSERQAACRSVRSLPPQGPAWLRAACHDVALLHAMLAALPCGRSDASLQPLEALYSQLALELRSATAEHVAAAADATGKSKSSVDGTVDVSTGSQSAGDGGDAEYALRNGATNGLLADGAPDERAQLPTAGGALTGTSAHSRASPRALHALAPMTLPGAASDNTEAAGVDDLPAIPAALWRDPNAGRAVDVILHALVASVSEARY